jgi:hypothetical protein
METETRMNGVINIVRVDHLIRLVCRISVLVVLIIIVIQPNG